MVFVIVYDFGRVLFVPHKRSLLGKICQRQREQDYAAIKVQKKAAWQYIRETEFRDRLIGETVCRTDINMITDELAVVEVKFSSTSTTTRTRLTVDVMIQFLG